MEILLLILIISINFNVIPSIKAKSKNFLNISKMEHYDFLFNSIENDYYNMKFIYNYSYDTIKIKHKLNNKQKRLIVCVFGILVTDEGLQIEKKMIEWLLQEYDVYCVYQKYPGILYEYPALRFAQWLSIKSNIEIILYIHTKGAFNKSPFQEKIRNLWKHEFTNPRSSLYISLLRNNVTDVSLPFRNGLKTWLNGMFISNRAFKMINKIDYHKGNRYYYENQIFANIKGKNNNIRIFGVLNDSISSFNVYGQVNIFLKYFQEIDYLNSKIKKKKKVFNILISLLIFIFFIKYFILKINKKIKKLANKI